MKIIIVGFLLLLVLVLVSACTKETATIANTYIINNSGHKIEIRPFRNNITVNESMQVIESGATKNVSYHANRGKGKGLSYGTSLVPFDSVVVLYGNSVRAIHYTFNRVGNNPKAVLFTDKRNLLNESNYSYEVVSETRRSINNKYTYTFTQQDYLNAQ